MKGLLSLVISSLCLIALSGCATCVTEMPADSSTLTHHHESAKLPNSPTLLRSPMKGHRALTAPKINATTQSNQNKKYPAVPDHHLALTKALPPNVNTKTGQATNAITEGFITFAYDEDQQPIIQTAPFQETVIRLAPGEKFTNISSGDPSRWSYAVAISGTDETAQQNILVKPSLPNIRTNLVISTDKRLYNLQLIASQTPAFTRSVHFTYPEDPLKATVNPVHAEGRGAAQCGLENILIEADCERQNNPPSARLHFDYHLTIPGFFSHTPAWKPIRVFDDGIHTYIQFPEHIAQHDLPALFIVKEGEKTCVNYRFQSPYFIVDNSFQEALLVSGVGQTQETVLIHHFGEEESTHAIG